LENGPRQSDAIDFVLRVERFYAALLQFANPVSSEEPSLGGKLLYGGELDEESCALVVAGNVAGAATLATTADVLVQKQAIRDGVVDFLVTSLDEALRILKNEVRKHERVAVCVGAAGDAIEREMAERGVQPDLVWPNAIDTGSSKTPFYVAWSVDSAPAQWLPKLDVIAIECLDRGQYAERRWLRLAPRYLGRMARGVRVLSADREFALRFVDKVRARVEGGEIGAAVSIQIVDSGGTEKHFFTPRS
jgi:Urocanase Rossmann-like domain